ncbi:MAG: response regulator transcription factor [Aurantimonas endophytica]|uniref:response regulator transcription factor n=1 Tax=Aurantimonas endophytica TaxID=1522175 RepID=UPI003001D869
MKVLLVEDDPEMADALRTALARRDIVLDVASDLAVAREAIASNSYDFLLIDRQLPDGDGKALLVEVQALEPSPRTIIVSAMGTAKDRITGLNEGADDYLAKPFEVDELVARLTAVRRRTSVFIPEKLLVAGNLTYDPISRDVHVEGEKLPLARRELLILEALLRNRGRTVMRGSLEETVYSYDDEIQSNSLEANVSRLRRKLAEAGCGLVVKNLRGIGYFLHEPT